MQHPQKSQNNTQSNQQTFRWSANLPNNQESNKANPQELVIKTQTPANAKTKQPQSKADNQNQVKQTQTLMANKSNKGNLGHH